MGIFERRDNLDGWISSNRNTLWQDNPHLNIHGNKFGRTLPPYISGCSPKKEQKPWVGRLDFVFGASRDPPRARMPVLTEIFEHLLDVLRNRPTK